MNHQYDAERTSRRWGYVVIGCLSTALVAAAVAVTVAIIHFQLPV